VYKRQQWVQARSSPAAYWECFCTTLCAPAESRSSAQLP